MSETAETADLTPQIETVQRELDQLETESISFCTLWKPLKKLLEAALKVVKNENLKTAIETLIAVGDAVCD